MVDLEYLAPINDATYKISVYGEVLSPRLQTANEGSCNWMNRISYCGNKLVQLRQRYFHGLFATPKQLFSFVHSLFYKKLLLTKRLRFTIGKYTDVMR
ncbi:MULTISPECIES: hypothetical protein [unclassified Aureispira]|uniref:hypothetical protein n=1 Tax=unclassified Aureispira TaxID=2649989 RepID=UPI000698AB7B|nr:MULTISPECIES: hypothetical protein [unclassified Aureispira]WMX14220.1 hypothetical protein QP953_25515 [Aureispira sp. CCB-E]